MGQAEAVEQTVVATRRFARRQETWFRADPRVRWLPADAPDLVERALQAVVQGEPTPEPDADEPFDEDA